ncbi:hypothetical protein [Streptomyces sp. NPDC017230]|uniref:hypothetical protein n=1 Tax=unclassified Streptomyces TaxID=2593676 RepID=UPI00378B9712
MACNLPIQIVIDRKKRLEPFMVLTAFEDLDGTQSVLRHEIGGAHGHHPDDPGRWLWQHSTGLDCGPAPGSDGAGYPDDF